MLYILTITEWKGDLESVAVQSLAFESLYMAVGFMLEFERANRVAKIEIEIIGYNATDSFDGVIVHDNRIGQSSK